VSRLGSVSQFTAVGAMLLASSCLPFSEPPAPLELEVPFGPPRVPLTGVLAQAGYEADRIEGLKSLLVSFRGETVLERYYNGSGPTRTANVKSVSKSVIAALIGIAIEKGLIPGVQTPIGPYFERYLEGEDPRKREITVEDLLTMRSGLERTSGRNYGAWVSSPSWVGYALRQPLLEEPGRSVRYSTGSSHLLAALLTKAAGESVFRFAQRRLAGPLGFELASWTRDPEGIYFGGNEMGLTPRQMLAFGKLYLNGGLGPSGQRILSREWIERSCISRGRSSFSGREYGYGWWIRQLAGQEVCYAWGYGGQFIFVVRDLDLVVVAASSTDPDTRRGRNSRIYALTANLIEGVLRSDAVTSTEATARR
jgi:CubicO group peptidase (beta-lactamase class C family)